MSMASRVAARRLVIYRRDHIDSLNALRRFGVADPGIFGGAIPYGVFIVAAGANLVIRLRHGMLFARIRRKHHVPFAVVHPYAVYTLFIRNDLHDLVGGPAVVVEHG